MKWKEKTPLMKLQGNTTSTDLAIQNNYLLISWSLRLSSEGNSILEIGCGTGQATKGFVDLGFDNLTCIELGQNLAEFTHEKFKNNQMLT